MSVADTPLGKRPVWLKGCAYVAGENSVCNKCGKIHNQTYAQMRDATPPIELERDRYKAALEKIAWDYGGPATSFLSAEDIGKIARTVLGAAKGRGTDGPS